ncbi:tRNA lysidine(34) synthetase TilS [Marinobacter subterrani]|uniref:tRNA(Ile)-lysidine synthase n=1 Tax=Marinobacter subterrani TaxID=1658765 RepID=A0A0J7J5V4_9GAMM|nr:tRNA lysidine(34) synthetase TilS [Marinobacter subterrani]KMQ73938.1 tRNA(Ile)-lysidine synthetase, N-terminal domain/tRNA(Ile)-lysidine synthetase, C-terminal domain [Marinobacter subterrani]
MTPGAEPTLGFHWPEALCAPVRALPDFSRLWVALSGGLDSTLLLHLAAQCHGGAGPVNAVHINHQLQPNAAETEAFCRSLCAGLNVPLVVERVSVASGEGSSGSGGIEEAARKARYAALERLVEPGDLLLMAHHGDDQAETVLFRLLRGSGVAGLAGMPASRALGGGRLFRPLLHLERSELERWARAAGLAWIDDPSNTDERFDRNFLRHRVLPLLRSRWPGLARRLRHTADACAESETLNRKLAALQWQSLAGEGDRLPVAGLYALSLAEQKNLIRWWARERGFQPPSITDWRQSLNDLLYAGQDREPELRADGFSLRRFQGDLYLVPETRPLPETPVVVEPGSSLRWGEWTLTLVASPKSPPPPIRVSTRQGGERVRFHPDGPSRSLKKWLQERAVPPWERARLPLVFAGPEGAGELIAIGDLWCSEQYSGGAHAAGWRLVVERECD